MTGASDSDPCTLRREFRGPVEDGHWPERIQARVVTPGPQPCVHGYDVESELARQCRFSDLVYLCLTGQLPTEECSLAFEISMMYLLPLSVVHAPAHAAVLARLSGANTSGVVGVAATALGEQARFILDELVVLLEALDSGSSEFPPVAYASTSEDAEAARRLSQALRSFGIGIPRLDPRLTRMSAIVVVLHHCGLRRREQLEAVVALSRLPAVLAEGFAERPANFREYPINLPSYFYEEAP